MTAQHYNSGFWLVVYNEQDGGRIERIAYKGIDLLTRPLLPFKAPEKDYGQYESRPVFGYDDCFPTVDACSYPGTDIIIPDHGELCWLKWNTEVKETSLRFSVDSELLPFNFTRTVRLKQSALEWSFAVKNTGLTPLPFQHIMHPLMPIEEISSLALPVYDKVVTEFGEPVPDFALPDLLSEFLLNQMPGYVAMLMLRGVQNGRFSVGFSEGLKLEVKYPADMFPTLGIWWNYGAYPDEDGCRRMEFAIEPIPGITSNLATAFEHGNYVSVSPREELCWKVDWIVTEE